MHIGYNKYIGYFLCTTLFCTLTHTIVHCELHPFCHPLVHHEGLLTLGQCPSIAVAGDSTLQHFSKHRVTQFNTMEPSLCITKQHSGTIQLCNDTKHYATQCNLLSSHCLTMGCYLVHPVIGLKHPVKLHHDMPMQTIRRWHYYHDMPDH